MRLVVLALLVLATTCQAEHECQNPKEITEDFTPVFDYGDNWSFNDCGVWNISGADAAPWRIAVSRTNGSTCVGILLSNYDFVTSECKEVADDFRKAPNSVKACTGKSYDQKVKSSGDTSVNCTDLEVVGVAALGKDSDETQLHLWRLKAAAPDTKPICLFNANPKQKAGYETDDFQIFDRKWKGRVAAKVGGAPNSSQTSALCVKIIGRGQSIEDKHDFSGDFLVKEVRGRMTLRGFFFWPVAEHKIFVYTDVVSFIKELVAKSHNMFIMPQVPPPKTKTDFSTAPTLNKKDECGLAPMPRRRRRSADVVNEPTNYVIGGVKAKKGAYPWHASLSYRPKELDVQEELDICGATLISNRVVLTAAHCFNHLNGHTASDFQIVFGMRNTGYQPNGQFVRADRIEVHPEYNINLRLYDVALLFLKEEAIMTANVRPICLWDDDYSLDVLRGRIGTVVGWGLTEDEKTMRRDRPDILLEGHLSVLGHKECYVQEKVFYRKFLHPGVNFCARGLDGARNKSVAACKGDSGGGFIIPKDGKWYLRGVVSFGVTKTIIDQDGQKDPSCNEDYPSLYVDLGSCMDWIVQQVARYAPLAPAIQ